MFSLLYNWGCGFGHRATNWPAGIDWGENEYLTFWVRSASNIDRHAKLRLYDNNYRYSAPCLINVRTAYRRQSFPKAALLSGAEPGFDIGNIMGIRIEDESPRKANFYLDDVCLASTINIYNGLATPQSAAHYWSTNIRFTATAQSAMTNISTVTLDLRPLGGPQVAMSNISGSARTNFRYTWRVPALISAGTYILPVTARDAAGRSSTARILFTSLCCSCAPNTRTIFDGESSFSRAHYSHSSCGSGITCSSKAYFTETTNAADIWQGSRSGKFVVTDPMGGSCLQTPSLGNWHGFGKKLSTELRLAYKSDGWVFLSLFRHTAENEMQPSRPIILPPSATYRTIITNLTCFTQDQFPLKNLVGIRLSAESPVTAFFDDIFFTNSVLIREAQAVVSGISNSPQRLVRFHALAVTGNLTVTTAYLDLSALGGPELAIMTNIAGGTQFAYSFTIASNFPDGEYLVPIQAVDNQGQTARRTIPCGIYPVVCRFSIEHQEQGYTRVPLQIVITAKDCLGQSATGFTGIVFLYTVPDNPRLEWSIPGTNSSFRSLPSTGSAVCALRPEDNGILTLLLTSSITQSITLKAISPGNPGTDSEGINPVRFFPLPRSPSHDTSRILIGPNPLREGSLYFDNLPASVRILVCTTGGRIIKRLSVENGNGWYEWDTWSDEGPLGHGVYLIRIENRDDAKDFKIIKIAVVR